MMRLHRMRILEAHIQCGAYIWVRGDAPTRNWLYKHDLIYFVDGASTVVTEKGRADFQKAKDEYAKRPRHTQPRVWELRYKERAKTYHGKDAVLTIEEVKVEGMDVDTQSIVVDENYVRLVKPVTVPAPGTPEYAKMAAEHNVALEKLAREQGIEIPAGRPLEAADIENAARVITEQYGQPAIDIGPPAEVIPAITAEEAVEAFKVKDWKPPTVPEPTVDLDEAVEDMNKAAGDDELAARRKENAAKERAVELARQIEAQQDRLRKYATETRVLDAYREIAQEIGLFGQGIEEIYVGKFNGKPFLFDPFIPNNALVFTKSAVDDSEIVHVGYDVAKALITKQPPNAIAIAFPSMEAMVHHFGERCWRCAGTGNISRNWTVMDQLCDQCNKTGWIKK